jgi:phytoene dehydrogenase-like protein
MTFDAIVIGAGHNGLVAASFLAKAGLKTLVLERTDRVGGCARTSEIAPGFRCPTLAHVAAIAPAIQRALALERHGLQIVRPDVDVCAPMLDGRVLTLWRDPGRAAQEIRACSTRDADRYAPFLDTVRRISAVLNAALGSPPPSIVDPTAGDLIELLQTGRRFRALGKADAYRLLRWLPMAVADFVGEWFESEPLRATVAAGGGLGSFLGPRSAGSTALLLLLGAAEAHPIANGWFARGGTGAVADALAAAALEAGVQIRTDAGVERIEVAGDAADAVTLASGERIAARAIVSSADPKRTLLGLIDPVHLPPELVRRVQNIRAHGTLAKVNYAVSALPDIAKQPRAALSGRIRLARDVAAIERAFDAAKYGRFADEPWIELTIPSLVDPSLAPQGQHVVSAYVQYAPYCLRGTTWDAERNRLGDIVTRTIGRYAPGFEASIVARHVNTPLDLERTYGLTGGHIFHGELALDQLFIARPLLGWARYATPIRNLYLCGAGTHPGTGLNGRSGALAAKAIIAALKRSRNR